MGLVIALIIIFSWSSHLVYVLISVEVDFQNPLIYLHLLLQAYLFTGLFITAHDSMHKTVSKNRSINKAVGYICSFLFAGLSYRKLVKNHMLHHKYPGGEEDPDFNTGSQNFFIWWGKFLARYISVLQLIIMAVLFNFGKIWFADESMIIFWIIPAFLSTFQLFFFGTYLPHRKPHAHLTEHNSRTQKKNHLWAMLSCYFFGYHVEHHSSPATPWWKLYKLK